MRKLSLKSDQELLNGIATSNADEANAIADMLVYLDEVKYRKLHLARGADSIYTFLAVQYGFSKNRAYRRMCAAEALSLEPTVERAIRENRTCLTYLEAGVIAIRLENKRRRKGGEPKLMLLQRRELIQAILKNGEAKRTIASFFPKIKADYNREEPITAELTEYTMAVNTDEAAKIKRVKELLSSKIIDVNWHDIAMAMVEITLNKLDPARKPRKAADETPTTEQRAYRSVYTERALEVRSGGQCEYVCEETGHRCTARHDLQTDHIIPVAHGGTDSFGNLRKLCRVHNLYLARKAGLPVDRYVQ